MKRLTILISTLLFLPFQIANAQVGQAYYVQVSNPTALIQALDTLNDTQAGRSDNIDVRLEVSVSNGTSAATHNIVVNGAAASDMDASRRANATSQDWADFISIVQDVAAPVAELVYVFMDVDNGKESIVTLGSFLVTNIDIGTNPIIPPLELISLINESGLFLGLLHRARALACVNATDFFEKLIASKLVLSPTCERSIRIPRSFISFTTIFPNSDNGELDVSPQPPPTRFFSL